MYLEDGRDLFRGVMILIFAAVAYWFDVFLGLALITAIGVLNLQSAFSDWCPADVFLRPMGLRMKVDRKANRRSPNAVS